MSTAETDMVTTKQDVISIWEQKAIVAATESGGPWFIPKDDLTQARNRQQYNDYMDALALLFAKQATVRRWEDRAAAETLSVAERAAAAAVGVLVRHLMQALTELRRMIYASAPTPDIPAEDYVLRETLCDGVWQTRDKRFAAGEVRSAFRDPQLHGADAYTVSDRNAQHDPDNPVWPKIGSAATILEAQEVIRQFLLKEIRSVNSHTSK